MKKTLYSLMALCFLHKSMAYDSISQDNAIAQAFSNDNDIYRSRSFTIEPLKSYPCQFDLTSYKGRKSLDLLSCVSLGNYQEEDNLSDEMCQHYIDSYKIMCSFDTPSEQASKILARQEQIAFYRKNKVMTEEEIKKLIQFFIEKKEWGTVINKESRKRAKDFVKQISNQCRKNFILRHSLSIGDAGLSGTVVLYPGHNLKIIEDLKESGISAAPSWSIGFINYEINFSKEILHVNLISVESFWRSRGHGYALTRYLADFAKEHFQYITTYMTVSCRNDHSQRIFEKVGFQRNARADSKPFYGATHYRNVSFPEWKRAQAVMTAWNKSHGQRYLVWLTKAYPEIFPNQYHKVGYRYY